MSSSGVRSMDSNHKQLVVLRCELLSKLHLNEGIRIYSQIYGPSHQQTTAAKSQLSTILMELSRLKWV
jgi:hypothetical protein